MSAPVDRSVQPDQHATQFRPPAVPQVKIDGFWGPRIDVVADSTIAILLDRAIAAGVLDQIDPSRPIPALRIPPHGQHGISAQMFWDSDVGKIIETAAHLLFRRKNPELERRIDELIDVYGHLQADDGYLDSWFQRMQPGKRWTNLRDCHELYNMGHLTEGAIAYYQATGKRKLVDIMCRCMDHVMTVLGPEPDKKKGYCGHPEVELALVKLARVTGERRYMDLSRYFVDERGHQPHYFDIEARLRAEDPADYHFGSHEYSQSHKPVREQHRVVGHAVRAMYLYSGMADISTEYGDDSLMAALETLWAHLTTQNLYLTGGLGPSHANEGFTADYDLPNESAYAETCASVGLVFWASRMLGRGADRRFADVMEQALYNGALSGLSLDGQSFFYENPLESRGSHNRWKWHHCPCCPPNISRLVASVGSYMYGEAQGEVAVHLYCQSVADLSIGGDRRVRITQTTNYPWEGAVALEVGVDVPSDFTISLRIPGWARSARLSINGGLIDLQQVTEKGYARLTRLWTDKDRIDLEVELAVERVHANPKVRQDVGRAAIRRGPLLYCLEGTDNGPILNSIVLPLTADFSAAFARDLLGGVVTLHTDGLEEAADWGSDLYQTTPPDLRLKRLKAVPYYAWDNRAPGEMLVWVRTQNRQTVSIVLPEQ